MKYTHTCPLCQHRSHTIEQADAHAYAHECGRIDAAVAEPDYALIYLDEDTEQQGVVVQGDDVASLLAQRDMLARVAGGLHYGVICLAPDVAADHFAAVLAEIAALTGKGGKADKH